MKQQIYVVINEDRFDGATKRFYTHPDNPTIDQFKEVTEDWMDSPLFTNLSEDEFDKMDEGGVEARLEKMGYISFPENSSLPPLTTIVFCYEVGESVWMEALSSVIE